MEKFPILCMLSALIVFFSAAVGVAGVQSGTKSHPFDSHSIEQRQGTAGFVEFGAAAQDTPMLAEVANHADRTTQIQGSVQVSF